MSQELIKKRKEIDVFWGELSACDHCVQIYENDDVFLDALEGYVAGGIRQGDAIIRSPRRPFAGSRKPARSERFDVVAAASRDQ